MKRTWIALLAAALTLLAALSFAQTSDIPRGHWAEEAVRTLVERGILTGYPDGTFRGNEPATRYQLALALYGFLRQVEEEIRQAGFSPSLAALSPEDMERLVRAVGELSGLLAEVELRVSALEAAAKGQNPPTAEEALQQAAARIEERLSAFSQALQSLGERVGNLEGEVDVLRRAQEKNQERTEEATALATALYRDLAALRQQHQALADAVKQLSTQVQALAARSAADPEARARLEALEKELAALREEVRRQKEEKATPAFPSLSLSGEGRFQGGSPGLLPVGPEASYGRGGFTVAAALEGLRLEAALGAALGGRGLAPEAALGLEAEGISLKATYSGYLPFALGGYLMRNEDPQGTVARTGVKLEGKAGSLSLLAVYGAASPANDPTPSLSGTFWGLRLSAGPLAVAYGEASGRIGVAAEAEVREGPFSLSAHGTATAPSGSLPWGPGSRLAYGMRAAYEASGFKVSAQAHGIDPSYAEGRAGMSQDARTPYYGQPQEAPGTLGASASLEAEAGFARVRAGVQTQGDYAGTPGSFSTAVAASLALSLSEPVRPFGFYAAAFSGGNGLLEFANPAPYTPGYRYASPERLGATAFGGGVEVAGPVALSLSGARHPVEGALEVRAQAQAQAQLEGPLQVKAEALGGYFDAPGTPAGSGYLVGAKAEAGLEAAPWAFSLKTSYGLLLYAGNGAFLPSRSGTDELRLDVTVGYRLGEVLLRGGYLLYRGRNLSALADPQAEGPFLSWDGSAPPWYTLPGNNQLSVQALRLGVSLASLSAEGYLGWNTSGPAQGFRISYKFGE